MVRPAVSTVAVVSVLLVVGTALAATATPATPSHQVNTTAVPGTTTPGANGTITEGTSPTEANGTGSDDPNRVRLDSADPGASTTHTVLVTVDRSTTGNLTRLELRYSDGSFSNFERAEVSVGVDESGTLPDGDVDTDLGVVRFRAVDGAETADHGIVSLDDAGPLDAGDELVVTVRNVTNPPGPAVDRVFLTAGTDADETIEAEAPFSVGIDGPYLGESAFMRYEFDEYGRLRLRAVLPEGGFVVVTASGESANGSGPVVGVTDYLDPGLQPLIRVDPNRTLPDGTRVVATLYRDSDGDGQFDDADDPYRVNGTVVSGRVRLDVVTVHRDTTTTTTTYRDRITQTTETTRLTQGQTRSVPERPSPTTVRGDGPGFGVPGVVAALLAVLAWRSRR